MQALYGILIGLAFALYGYLLGCISFARIIARAHGVDITAVGSHNPGGTNVWRTLGWRAGLSCMLLDLVKGFLAAFIPLVLILFVPGIEAAIGPMAFGGHSHLTILAAIGGLGAALGHSFPVFYRFKGGKNVMVTCGFIAAVSPVLMLFGLTCFLIALFVSRRVAVGSLTAAASVILGGVTITVLTGLQVQGFQYLGMFLGNNNYFLFDWLAFLIVLFSALLVVVRHRSNIEKMVEGEAGKDF